MEYTKIDFDDINWVKKGKLFRGTFQSGLELKLLRNIAENHLPVYHGSLDKEKKITCASTQLLTAVNYPSSYRDPDMVMLAPIPNRPLNWPFSRYPLVMEINAEKYKSQLYRGIEWGEVIIEGHIDIDDLKVLYSSHKNIFQNEAATEREIEFINDLLRKGARKYHYSRQDSLILYYNKEPERVINFLCRWVYGLSRNKYSTTQKNFIITAIETIKKKIT